MLKEFNLNFKLQDTFFDYLKSPLGIGYWRLIGGLSNLINNYSLRLVYIQKLAMKAQNCTAMITKMNVQQFVR